MRLIDADKLLVDMKKELEKAVNDENLDKDECMVILTSAIALKDFVNRQPIAFDVDKIIKRLEEEMYVDKNGNNVLQGGTIEYEKKYKYEIGCNYGLTKAIKIVKRGVIDENIWI